MNLNRMKNHYAEESPIIIKLNGKKAEAFKGQNVQYAYVYFVSFYRAYLSVYHFIWSKCEMNFSLRQKTSSKTTTTKWIDRKWKQLLTRLISLSHLIRISIITNVYNSHVHYWWCRHHVFAYQMYPVGISDMRLIDGKVSTTWCQRQVVRANTTFNAFLLPEVPQTSNNRIHVDMTR